MIELKMQGFRRSSSSSASSSPSNVDVGGNRGGDTDDTSDHASTPRRWPLVDDQDPAVDASTEDEEEDEGRASYHPTPKLSVQPIKQASGLLVSRRRQIEQAR